MATITPEPISAFMGQEFLRSSQFLMLMPGNRYISLETSKKISVLCESVDFPGVNAVTTDYTMPGLNRIKVPYSKEYQDVTFTFLHSVDSPIYYELIKWTRAASGTGGNAIEGNAVTVPYFDEYVAPKIELYQLTDVANPSSRFRGLSNILSAIDKLNARLINSNSLFNATRIGERFVSEVNANTIDRAPRAVFNKVEFYNIHPISVQNIPANWAEDGFVRITATFTYEYFKIMPYDETRFNVSVEEL